MMKPHIFSLTVAGLLFSTMVNAEEQNYQQCLFNPANEVAAEQAGQSTAVFCASRHFDTAPTAFQAQVLNQDIEGFKQRDPKFKAFYDGIRQHGSNDIYTDRQIILMFIDKREVNKD
ncbi:hypothetical protein [Methylophaga sp. UBA678]|uniref:hypothetical protein n=1 Tax=Methylophaga sp. UBA678 TaxID=1946901 RepID=UPI00259C78DC|nr:hypothetical protein [Methylophaga sp. UBA678]|tara:strand:+ start:56516 stop:56866 length:351 start_codon:yes stop_codon:yes gene_type:complete